MRGARLGWASWVSCVIFAGCTISIPDVVPPNGANGDGGAPVSCAAAGAALCDDFEAPLNTAQWNDIKRSGASVVERDSTVFHRGQSSLHVRLDGAEHEATISHSTRPSDLPADLYVRAFFYVPPSPAPTAGTVEGLAMVVARDGASGLILGRDANSALYLTNYSSGAAENAVSRTSAFPTPAAWKCVEWHISRSGLVEISFDGVATDVKQTGVNIPPYEQLRFGVSFLNAPGAPFETWIDDLYVDKAPVGCSK